LGCVVVNIGGEDIQAGTPHLILGLVWQVVKIGLLEQVNIDKHPELVALLNENEDIERFINVAPEVNLLRWFNFHLNRAGHRRQVNNFSGDIRDGENYLVLLEQIGRGVVPRGSSREPDPRRRAEMVCQYAKELGCPSFVTPDDILNGNDKLNLAFTAYLFNKYPGLEVIDDNVGQQRALEEAENLLKEKFRREEEERKRKWEQEDLDRQQTFLDEEEERKRKWEDEERNRRQSLQNEYDSMKQQLSEEQQRLKLQAQQQEEDRRRREKEAEDEKRRREEDMKRFELERERARREEEERRRQWESDFRLKEARRLEENQKRLEEEKRRLDEDHRREQFEGENKKREEENKRRYEEYMRFQQQEQERKRQLDEQMRQNAWNEYYKQIETRRQQELLQTQLQQQQQQQLYQTQLQQQQQQLYQQQLQQMYQTTTYTQPMYQPYTTTTTYTQPQPQPQTVQVTKTVKTESKRSKFPITRLVITVVRCRRLAKKDTFSKADPYVVLMHDNLRQKNLLFKKYTKSCIQPRF